MSTLNIQRALFFFLTAVFLCYGIYALIAYIVVYYASFEYLNSNRNYLRMTLHQVWNWLYIAYFAFVVFVRCHIIKFYETTNYHLNTAEHLFFAFLICQTLLIYMQIFGILKKKWLLRLTLVFGTLNLIGLINEFFQNFYQQTSFFYLEAADLKDMVINFIGSLSFVVVSVIRKRKKILKLNTSKNKV